MILRLNNYLKGVNWIMEKNDSTRKINLELLELGRKTIANLEAVCEEPMKHNEALLMQILEHNKDTEYGKKMGFADIHSVEEYQRKMPITTYDDYAEYILRMTENGEQNLICADEIHHYNKTSGTMGTPKRIPMTDRALEHFQRYSLISQFALAEKECGMDFVNGRHFTVAEIPDIEGCLPCGASYSAVSQKVGRMQRSLMPDILTAPNDVMFPVGEMNTRYLRARYALMERDTVSIRGSFFSFLLDQLRYIESDWELLCNDIETGTIDASITMPAEVRQKLERELQPMPERAKELREIFRGGFETPIVKKLWPKLTFVSAIATGAFVPSFNMTRERYLGNDIPVIKLGIVASEGIFTTVYAANQDDGVVIPDENFYEFLPLDAGDDFSKILTLDQVEIGKEYELILTNTSGLYRYRMKDVMRVVGKYKNAPTMLFSYRRDQTISIMGEKTTEKALTAAIQKTADELGFTLVDFSVYADVEASPMRYQYFVEIENLPANVSPKIIRATLDEYLAEVNPSMGEKIRAKICGGTRLNFLEPEAYRLYRDMMTARGAAAIQIKPVHIIANERQRKFFFGMTEYSCEIMR